MVLSMAKTRACTTLVSMARNRKTNWSGSAERQPAEVQRAHQADAERGEADQQHVLAEDVAEESAGERHRLGQLADHVDGQGQRHQRPLDRRARAAGEVPEPAEEAQLADGGELHVDEDGDRQRQGDVEARGRRLDQRHEAEQVHGQDVDEQAAEEGRVARPVAGPEDVHHLLVDLLDHDLDQVLQPPGQQLRPAHRHRHRQHQQQRHQHREDDRLEAVDDVGPGAVLDWPDQDAEEGVEAARAPAAAACSPPGPHPARTPPRRAPAGIAAGGSALAPPPRAGRGRPCPPSPRAQGPQREPGDQRQRAPPARSRARGSSVTRAHPREPSSEQRDRLEHDDRQRQGEADHERGDAAAGAAAPRRCRRAPASPAPASAARPARPRATRAPRAGRSGARPVPRAAAGWRATMPRRRRAPGPRRRSGGPP